MRFDTVVMGRRTYEPALSLGITSPYAHLRQVVVSRSLDPAGADIEVVGSDVVETVRALKAESSTLDIYLAGSGIPAFGRVFRPTAFALESVRSFDAGTIVETYSRGAAAGAGE